jgi:hypothetical protein
MWKTYQLSRFNNRTDPFLSGHASRRRRKEDSTKLLSTTGRRKEGSKNLPVGCVSAPCGSTISWAQFKLLAQTTRVEHVGMYI